MPEQYKMQGDNLQSMFLRYKFICVIGTGPELKIAVPKSNKNVPDNSIVTGKRRATPAIMLVQKSRKDLSGVYLIGEKNNSQAVPHGARINFKRFQMELRRN